MKILPPQTFLKMSLKKSIQWNDHPRTVLTSLTMYMVVSFSQMSVLLTLASFGWITSTTKLAGKQRVVLALTLTDLNKLLLTICYSQFVTHNFFANTNNFFANAHTLFFNTHNLLILIICYQQFVTHNMSHSFHFIFEVLQQLFVPSGQQCFLCRIMKLKWQGHVGPYSRKSAL